MSALVAIKARLARVSDAGNIGQDEYDDLAIAHYEDDVRALVGEVERLTDRSRSLRDHLDLALRSWHFEAHQGDGFDERHVPIYEAAKAALACGERFGSKSCAKPAGHVAAGDAWHESKSGSSWPDGCDKASP